MADGPDWVVRSNNTAWHRPEQAHQGRQIRLPLDAAIVPEGFATTRCGCNCNALAYQPGHPFWRWQSPLPEPWRTGR